MLMSTSYRIDRFRKSALWNSGPKYLQRLCFKHVHPFRVELVERIDRRVFTAHVPYNSFKTYLHWKIEEKRNTENRRKEGLRIVDMLKSTGPNMN